VGGIGGIPRTDFGGDIGGACDLDEIDELLEFAEMGIGDIARLDLGGE
jgi:hypothetical protein